MTPEFEARLRKAVWEDLGWLETTHPALAGTCERIVKKVLAILNSPPPDMGVGACDASAETLERQVLRLLEQGNSIPPEIRKVIEEDWDELIHFKHDGTE